MSLPVQVTNVSCGSSHSLAILSESRLQVHPPLRVAATLTASKLHFVFFLEECSGSLSCFDRQYTCGHADCDLLVAWGRGEDGQLGERLVACRWIDICSEASVTPIVQACWRRLSAFSSLERRLKLALVAAALRDEQWPCTRLRDSELIQGRSAHSKSMLLAIVPAAEGLGCAVQLSGRRQA